MHSLGWRNRFWIGFHLGSFVALFAHWRIGFHFLFLAKSERKVAHSREIIIGVPHTLMVSFILPLYKYREHGETTNGAGLVQPVLGWRMVLLLFWKWMQILTWASRTWAHLMIKVDMFSVQYVDKIKTCLENLFTSSSNWIPAQLVSK